MADINIEKKKKPVWPWILAILIAAAVIWMLTDGNNTSDYESEVSTVETEDQFNDSDNQFDQNNQFGEQRENQDTIYGQGGEQGAAMAFVNFINENGDEVTKSHEYSHQALTHLSNAIESIAQQNNVSIENREDLNKIKEQADKLMREKNSSEHANILSDAFNSAAQVINNIQDDQFPELEQEANDVTNAADEIDPGVIVTNQNDAVKEFYETSATALEEMQNQNNNVSMNN